MDPLVGSILIKTILLTDTETSTKCPATRACGVVHYWTMGLYLALQSVYLSGQLHRVPAEVIHGDGIVPVAEVVLLT